MIARRRVIYHETKTGHERWLVSYADFITLLFGFFVVMYSVSQVSDQKYRVLSETLANIFEGKVPEEAEIREMIDRYPLDETAQISGLSPVVEATDNEVLARDLAQTLVHMVKAGDVSVLALEDSVAINMNANALFASGSAEPSTTARQAFADVAEQLQQADYRIEVAGHTDNIPIANAQFANNWELSATRATAIVALLAADGVNPAHLKAAGFGEFSPIVNNDTEQGRSQNRRVVLTVTRAVTTAEAPPTGEVSSPPSSPLVDEMSEGPVSASDNSDSDNSDSDNAYSDNSDSDNADELAPVRLKSGGLLFSSDPELPRAD